MQRFFKRVSSASFWLLLAVLALSLPAVAQTTGSVSGTVVDQGDAVVPGATVALKNDATGSTSQATTNAQGAFRFDQVVPGIYTVTITKEGFRTVVQSNVDVRIARSSDVGFKKLEVGSISETVEVRSDTVPIIETQNAQITNTLSARQVQQLRTGFGGIDTLAILTPGVVPGMGNINSNGMQVAANGQRSRSTQFNLDGLQMNDITIGGPAFFVRNLDAIQEYQVITNQFSAEVGRNLGATVNIITKSGTNSVHGSVSYGLGASYLDSKSAFESRDNDDKAPYLNHSWALHAGGPILKDQLFWFVSYRGRKQGGANNSIGTTSNRVITPAGLAALQAAYPGSNELAIYAARGPFAIPDGSPACVTGTSSLQTFAGVLTDTCAIKRLIPSNTEEKEWNVKGDYVRGKHTVSGGYAYQLDDFCCSGGGNGYFIDIPNSGTSVRFTHAYNATPHIVNFFKFSYGKLGVTFETTNQGNTEPISNVHANLTRVDMPTGYLDFGLATNLPQNRFLNSYQFTDNITWQRGRHTIKFGGDINLNRTGLFFLPFLNGQFSYDTTQAFADSNPSSVSFTSGATSFDPVQWDRFFYVQDDFRIRPNLTINLGLRYEYSGQPINRAVDEVLARESDPATALWLQTVPIEDRTIRRAQNDANNFAPRIGFAWSPRIWPTLFGDNKTVIRGGYGMSYELAFYNILLNMTTAAPRVFAFALPRGGGAFGIPGAGTGNDVRGAIAVPTNTIDPRTFAQTQLSEDFHSPYGQNWSLGIQREFLGRQVVEVRYVGSNSVGQFQSYNANPLFTNLATDFPQFVPAGVTPCATVGATGFGRPDCDFARVRVRDNSAFSNYHSLQVRYDTRNLFNQFTGGAAYTWSKGIDNVSEIFGFFGDGSIAFSENPLDYKAGERGISNQNLRQTLTLHYVWDSPFMRSQNGVLGKIVGGWSVSGIALFLSGRPYTPFQFTGNSYCGQDSAFNGFFVGLLATCRPFLSNRNAPETAVGQYDALGNLTFASGGTGATTPDAVRWILNNNNAVAVLGTPFGAGRNLSGIEGAGTNRVDIGIDKRVKFTEKFSMKGRVAMVNAFNRRNFGTPNTQIGTTTFGNPNENDVGGRSIRLFWFVEW